METMIAEIGPQVSAEDMAFLVVVDVVLSGIGIVACIRLFWRSRDSAREISRQNSGNAALGQFLGRLAFGGWFLFWGAGVVWVDKFSLGRHSAPFLTRETHPLLFWFTVGTVELLGVAIIGHSIRKWLRHRRRMSVLKSSACLQ